MFWLLVLFCSLLFSLVRVCHLAVALADDGDAEGALPGGGDGRIKPARFVST